MDSAWPMYCHDTRHTGRSQYSTASNSGDEKWWFKLVNGSISDSAIVIDADGIIYVAIFSEGIWAVYPNGTLKWKYEMDGIVSTPAIDENGTIYVCSGTLATGAYFYAINSNGTLKWKYDTDCVYLFTSPVIGDNGIIYFASFKSSSSDNAGYIHALYPNGTLKWKYKTERFVYSSPAIGQDGTIYFGDHSRHLYALFPNGTLRWKVKIAEDWITGSPSIAEDGTIYIVSCDEYLYAVNPDGIVKWKYKIGEKFYANPSLAEDGTIYVTSDSELYAVYPDGTEKWTRKLDGMVAYYGSQTVSADGTIYVGGSNYLLAVNPDGTKKWCKKVRTDHCYAESSPVIAEDGTIYIVFFHRGPGHINETEKYSCLHAFGELDPNAPSAPTINGETSGTIRKEYEYTFNSTEMFIIISNGDMKWVGYILTGLVRMILVRK
jgi:outer membrane protein assembly factor BamB